MTVKESATSMSRALSAAAEEVDRLAVAGLIASSATLSARSADREPIWTLHLYAGDPDGDQEEAVDLAVLAGYHLIREVVSDGAVLAYLALGGDVWAPQTAIIRRRRATAEEIDAADGEGSGA